jgi:hypothetical protein
MGGFWGAVFGIASVVGSILGHSRAKKAAKAQEKAIKQLAATAKKVSPVQAVDRTAEAQKFGSTSINRMLANMFGRQQTVLTGPQGKKNRTILGV